MTTDTTTDPRQVEKTAAARTETGPQTGAAAATADDAAADTEHADAEEPTGPVAELLESMTELTELMEEEIGLLSGHDPDRMHEVQQRKTQLAAAYEMRVKALKADADTLESLDGEAREALRAAAEEFHATARRNGRALQAAQRVTEDLLSNTVEIVKKHRRDNSGYSARGVRRGETERHSAPLTFDQSL